MLRPVFTIRIWPVVALAVLMLAVSCAPSGTVIKVESPDSQIQVNETITVPIKVENIANLTAVEIHLSFDTSVLEVVELKEGGFIHVDFSVQNTFDNAAGTIDYAVAQLDRAPATGSGTLFEIVFRGKASGDSPISFRETEAAPAGVLLSDANGAALQVSSTNGTVNVK